MGQLCAAAVSNGINIRILMQPDGARQYRFPITQGIGISPSRFPLWHLGRMSKCATKMVAFRPDHIVCREKTILKCS